MLTKLTRTQKAGCMGASEFTSRKTDEKQMISPFYTLLFQPYISRVSLRKEVIKSDAASSYTAVIRPSHFFLYLISLKLENTKQFANPLSKSRLLSLMNMRKKNNHKMIIEFHLPSVNKQSPMRTARFKLLKSTPAASMSRKDVIFCILMSDLAFTIILVAAAGRYVILAISFMNQKSNIYIVSTDQNIYPLEIKQNIQMTISQWALQDTASVITNGRNINYQLMDKFICKETKIIQKQSAGSKNILRDFQRIKSRTTPSSDQKYAAIFSFIHGEQQQSDRKQSQQRQHNTVLKLYLCFFAEVNPCTSHTIDMNSQISILLFCKSQRLMKLLFQL